MVVVDMVFQWGQWIIRYFSLACDWFSSPNQILDEVITALCDFPILGHIFTAMSLDELIGLSPIEFILGPGLLLFLSLKLTLFVKDVIL